MIPDSSSSFLTFFPILILLIIVMRCDERLLFIRMDASSFFLPSLIIIIVILIHCNREYLDVTKIVFLKKISEGNGSLTLLLIIISVCLLMCPLIPCLLSSTQFPHLNSSILRHFLLWKECNHCSSLESVSGLHQIKYSRERKREK